MELMKAIKIRASARAYSGRPIPGHVLEEMLEAARLAPSGGNGQSHCFGVIQNPELKVQLAHAAGEQMWIATAPVVIACCADISEDLRELPEDDFGLAVNKLRWGSEFVQYLNDCPDRKNIKKLLANSVPLIPAQHIFLTAVSHGLSACFIGYLDTERAAKVLKLPEHMACLFLLPVGYAQGEVTPRRKKSVSEISFVDAWGAQSL